MDEPIDTPDDGGERDLPEPGHATPSDRPAHAIRPGRRRLTVGAGLAAGLAAIGLGTVSLLSAPDETPSGPHTLEAITVEEPPSATVPFSGPEIFALVDRPKDFGPLSDAQRRASCLAGLGYPAATPVLGATPVKINGRSAVLLVLPDDRVGVVVALAVPSSCSSADTGLLASTVVARP